MSDPVINIIHTPCKNCVFAQYTDNTQTDCHLKLLDKFRAHDIEIIEAYDEEKEFYVVNNKKCYAYKDDKYFAARKLSNLSLEDKIEYIKQILHINYIAIINLKDIELSDLKNICNTLTESVSKPKKIILVRYFDNEKKYKYADIKPILDTTSIKWRIQTILDADLTYEDILHNITNINKKYNCILSINGYSSNINNIISCAEDSIFNKFKPFSVISNETNNILLYNSLMYRTGIINGVDILKNKEIYTIV